MSKCTSCDKPAVGSFIIYLGCCSRPQDEGTQLDTRRVEIIKYCKDHRP